MPDRHARCAAVATRVSVLLPLPLEGPYDYEAAADAPLAPGDFVHVPLGGRTLVGVVWGAAKGDVEPQKLKRVIERLPVPPLREELRRLVDWVANYTLSPPGAVLRMAMSVPGALAPARGVTAYALGENGRAALAAGGDSLTSGASPRARRSRRRAAAPGCGAGAPGCLRHRRGARACRRRPDRARPRYRAGRGRRSPTGGAPARRCRRTSARRRTS